MLTKLALLAASLALPLTAAASSLESALAEVTAGRLTGCSSFDIDGVKALSDRIGKKDVSAAEKRYLYLCIGGVRNESAIPALLRLISTKNEHLAESSGSAIVATVALHEGKSADTVRALLNCRHAGVRNQALRLLWEHAWDPVFVPKVKELLLKDSNEGNRVAAAYTLAARKIVDAKPELEKALKDKSEKVSGAAEHTLRLLENKK